jgi:endoglycosylceramidase
MCATGEPRVDKKETCYRWHENRIGQRSEDAARLGVPLHLTEFGACLTEGPCTQEITQVAQIADHHLVGWAYWQYKYYDDLTTSAGTGSEGFWNMDGTLQEWKVKALSRTYLKATQGAPLIQNFKHETGQFYAKFDVDTTI